MSGRSPTATTRVAAVIGDPIAHSLSPSIFNAAFAADGLDWVFVAFQVREGAAPAAVSAMRALGLGGLSVTMPHKEAVVACVDRLTPDAEVLGAVNSIRHEGGALVGDNTDGPGFVRALAVEAGIEPAGRRFGVVGAGGAARAVVLALGRAGAGEVVVVNRTPERAAVAAGLAGSAGRLGSPDDLPEVDVVINATPVGMGGGSRDEFPIPPTALREGQVVADLVYEPAVTPLLAAAREKGLVAVNGAGMLLHQAALQYEAWTGATAPLAAMQAAMRRT